MDNNFKIPSLLEYIEETKQLQFKQEPKPSGKLIFLRKISWTFYIASIFLGFFSIPDIIEKIFGIEMELIRFILPIFLIYLTYNFRKAILPKKNITNKTIASSYQNIISVMSNYGFAQTANDLDNIFKCATLMENINKEFIIIIDEALVKYIQIIIKILSISHTQISENQSNNSQKNNLDLKHYEINKNTIHNLQNTNKKDFKKFYNKIKYSQPYDDKKHNNIHNISIFNLIEITLGKKTSIITIKDIIKIGHGKNFEGIEILNGLILIGKNEKFDGIIFGPLMFGKKIHNNLSKESKKANKVFTLLPIENIDEKSYCTFYTAHFLNKNKELRQIAESACKEISEIRTQCDEVIANKINNELQKTSSNLKEKLEREKRIMNELKDI